MEVKKFGLRQTAEKHGLAMTKSGKLDKRTRIGRALQPLIDECKDLTEAQTESLPQDTPSLK